MSPASESWRCERVRQHLEAFVDGALEPSRTHQIQAHLDRCPSCATEARTTLAIQGELRALPEIDTPATVIEEILRQTKRTRKPRRVLDRFQGLWPRPVWATLAAASLAIPLGLAVWSQRPSKVEGPDAAAIAQATAEARYALTLAGLATRRAGLVLRDDALRNQIVVPTARSLAHSLQRAPEANPGAPDKGVDDV